ncbi:MAG: hypothetical protein EON90_12540 [Brevundimonas sp.]|nr:MAG: hypothetical protein EON90_12540 [Brevundimonas sp.]
MSEKIHVFQALFDARYDAVAKRIANPLVTLDEVADAIRELVRTEVIKLSDRNPANFIKDYLRSSQRNAIWPPSIRDAGYTARQRTGVGQCFEFVPIPDGQEPFPDDFLPTGNEPTFTLQTLSLPETTREIVRVDEQSLAQIAVKLHLLEHFLASSPNALGNGLREITHLQNNVKLRSSEIDALYKAVAHLDHASKTGAIAVEVKIGEPIIAEQIEKQALAILADRAFEFCIPVIVKRVRRGEIVLMQLAPVGRQDIDVDGGIDIGGVVYGARYVFAPELPKL